jgi:hypothetical protein
VNSFLNGNTKMTAGETAQIQANMNVVHNILGVSSKEVELELAA